MFLPSCLLFNLLVLNPLDKVGPSIFEKSMVW